MTSEMSSSMQSRRLPGGGVHGTPESEFSIECFQNYTAPEVFIQGLAGIVNQGDVEIMIRAQKHMLQRFEKTNEMLLNCNALSASRLKTATEDFKRHVKLLNELKKDIDYIFRKIRNIKSKISQQYPNAYAEAIPQRNSFAEEAEDDEEAEKRSVVENIPSTSGVASAVVGTVTDPSGNTSHLSSISKKSSKNNDQTTVEYVQMEENSDNGKPLENDLIRKVCSIEVSNNANDSSDCTSEDTG